MTHQVKEMQVLVTQMPLKSLLFMLFEDISLGQAQIHAWTAFVILCDTSSEGGKCAYDSSISSESLLFMLKLLTDERDGGFVQAWAASDGDLCIFSDTLMG